MKQLNLAAAFAVLLLVAPCVSAQTVLFSDSFDRVSGTPNENGQIEGAPNPLASTSWGDNDNANGGVISQTYEIGPDIRGGNRHQYVDGDLARFRSGWAEIQHDFGSDPNVANGGGIIIEFDATISDASPGWLAIAIGQSEAESTDEGDNNSVFLMVEDTVDLGILFGGVSGGGTSTILEIFEGDDDPENPFTTAFDGDWGFGTSANTEQNFRIEIASANFAADEASATANIFVTHPTFGERQVLTNYTFDWDADGEAYIGFSSNKDQGDPENLDREVRIDNLVISTLNTVVIDPGNFPGDANGDGKVDLLDLDILGSNFGNTGTVFGQGDFNQDGTVDLLDLDILGSNFGNMQMAISIPEPTSVLMLATLVGLGLATRRKT